MSAPAATAEFRLEEARRARQPHDNRHLESRRPAVHPSQSGASTTSSLRADVKRRKNRKSSSRERRLPPGPARASKPMHGDAAIRLMVGGRVVVRVDAGNEDLVAGFDERAGERLDECADTSVWSRWILGADEAEAHAVTRRSRAARRERADSNRPSARRAPGRATVASPPGRGRDLRGSP